MPLVSVIIPTYNRSRLVKEAIDSVLKQTYADSEILVVDDGSTDETAQVLSKISDQRIKYFHKNNDGLSNARNLGITKSRGEFIAFLDSDDIWPVNYLEIITDRLEENREYGLAYSMFTNVYPDGHREPAFQKASFLSGNLTRYYFGRMPCILPSAAVMRRDVLADLYFDEYLKVSEDFDFFLRLSVKTKFLFVPEATVLRRIFGNNLSIQFQNSICLNSILILERFFRHFNDKKIIPAITARKKISREYRSAARIHIKDGNREAAIKLLKKAIFYYPWDYQCYKRLLKALFISKKDDTLPDWQMPESLPTYVTVNKEATFKAVDK